MSYAEKDEQRGASKKGKPSPDHIKAIADRAQARAEGRDP